MEVDNSRLLPTIEMRRKPMYRFLHPGWLILFAIVVVLYIIGIERIFMFILLVACIYSIIRDSPDKKPTQIQLPERRYKPPRA